MDTADELAVLRVALPAILTALIIDADRRRREGPCLSCAGCALLVPRGDLRVVADVRLCPDCRGRPLVPGPVA